LPSLFQEIIKKYPIFFREGAYLHGLDGVACHEDVALSREVYACVSYPSALLMKVRSYSAFCDEVVLRIL
jgi:hypothetical protein